MEYRIQREHTPKRIIGVTLAHRYISSLVFAEYYTVDGHYPAVGEGDYCRLDWYDAKQPHLF
jgi:hypothetical protein